MRTRSALPQTFSCATLSARVERCGFTLMELLVTVSIISILAAVAIPSYLRAIDRAKVRASQDILRTIYTGEKVFFARNRVFKQINVGLPDNADCTESSEWPEIFVDCPNINPLGTASGPVLFDVECPDGPACQQFEANAMISGKTKVVTIDQDGRITCDATVPC